MPTLNRRAKPSNRFRGSNSHKQVSLRDARTPLVCIWSIYRGLFLATHLKP